MRQDEGEQAAVMVADGESVTCKRRRRLKSQLAREPAAEGDANMGITEALTPARGTPTRTPDGRAAAQLCGHTDGDRVAGGAGGYQRGDELQGAEL